MWFLSKAEKKIRNENLAQAANFLAVIFNPETPKNIVQETSLKLNEFIKSLTPKRRIALSKKLPSDSLLDSENGKDFKLPKNKNIKEVFFHFFGMDENWSLLRNCLGLLMVHCPEYPTYFIPAFTQAKQTGDAKEMKKGEGIRGIITGGLEGIAVGALVSGKKIRPKEMIPYIFLGAGLQLISSLVFPWLGEKIGKYLYNKRMYEKPNGITPKTDISANNDQPLTQVQSSNSNPIQFKAKMPYSKIPSGSLKI